MSRCNSKFYIDKTKSQENGYYNFEGGGGLGIGGSSSVGLMNLNEGNGTGIRGNPYRNRIINDPEHKMLSYNGFSNLPASVVLRFKLCDINKPKIGKKDKLKFKKSIR